MKDDPSRAAEHGVLTSDQSSSLSRPSRLTALRLSGMMDSPAEEDFDRAARLASRILSAPVALVSFVDDTRQFFKAQTGLTGKAAKERGTKISHSMCRIVVEQEAPLVIKDTTRDTRVKGHPAVDELAVKAYAGVPIFAPDGSALGSFCAIDHAPRDWDSDDLDTLKDLAKIVEAELALRATVAQRELVLDEMSHRIKNLFSMINGMVRLDLRSADGAQDLAARLTQRMSALNTAHQLIVPVFAADRAKVPDTHLEALFTRLLAPHTTGEDNRLEMAGPDVRVGEKSVIYLALALHEVATNAVKYGALGDPEGRVSIRWHVTEETAEIAWREEGPERPQAAMMPGDPGFGSRLMDIAIRAQLGGDFHARKDKGVFEMDISVPLAQLAL